jgi:DNA polymerase-3 subunit alpha
VSLPDIDIDFDDEGRSSVMDYVIRKYGSKQVAQIITYGRWQRNQLFVTQHVCWIYPLFEADKIANDSGHDAVKWNLARFLNEDEALIKKAVRRKNGIK